MSALLEVRALTKTFDVGGAIRRRPLRALDAVDLDVEAGTTLGLVGESGSGKSTLARCLLRLVEPTSGRIVFDGDDLTDRPGRRVADIYQRAQMVFQDPNSSLNPRMTIGELVAEPLRLHLGRSRRDSADRVDELLALVGLTPHHADRYPHQLSGGQRQRVGIARALAPEPTLLILDEPTSSLDVSVRGQILQLLVELQRELGLTYLFISHDLGVVRHLCDQVAVLYLGKVVEQGPSAEVFGSPRHPYTQALLSAVPAPRWGSRPERVRLKGEIPSPINLPTGCRLVGRCPWEIDECSTVHPELRNADGGHHNGHRVACHVVNRTQLQLQSPEYLRSRRRER